MTKNTRPWWTDPEQRAEWALQTALEAADWTDPEEIIEENTDEQADRDGIPAEYVRVLLAEAKKALQSITNP